MRILPFKFNIFAFIVGFSLGFLYVYLVTPKKKIIVRFPTPYNCGKIVYNDEHDPMMCYKYKSEVVECSSNNGNMKPQPVF